MRESFREGWCGPIAGRGRRCGEVSKRSGMRQESSDGVAIEVEDARTNNLRGVTCRFPHGRMTVVSGVSGSGKSSLAFDTVYAEGQRRYTETLSTYARQFLQEMQRPPVGALRRMLPALALRQGNPVSNARSTVATVTEVADHLQMLFARAGEVSCRLCGGAVSRTTVADARRWLEENVPGERVLLCGVLRPDGEEEVGPLLRQLAAEGYRRLVRGGEVVELDTVGAADALGWSRLVVVLDRLKVVAGEPRLAAALEAAFAFGEGVAEVVLWDRTGEGEPAVRRFDPRFTCTACGEPHPEPIPALFKPTAALGSCPVCDGYGRTVGIDPALVVPDPRRTLKEGAVVPLAVPSASRERTALRKMCERRGVPMDVPWLAMPVASRQLVMRGDGEWGGVRGMFRRLEEDRYKPQVRIFLARFRGYSECDACEGTGLGEHARVVRVGELHIGEVLTLRVSEVREWLGGLRLPADRERALAALCREIGSRLGFLEEAGVGYLTLNRASRTLSGGEMHRVLLATSIGRTLTDTCYVLDEPTAGLHPHDTARLITLVERLRDLGNTVVIVEHDPDVLGRADHVIELGPEGGDRGGELLYEGPPGGLRGTDTPSGEMLRSRGALAGGRVAASLPRLTVRHACLHNLKDVEASFPHGMLSVVTGVSGSGKSTLVHDVLFRKLMEARGQQSSEALGPAVVDGDAFDEVVLVDQGAISRSTRSCALTFSGAYTPIRELFAETAEARQSGLKPGAFSFNTAGGRCERCEGLGVVTVEMHFMADVEIPCDVCDGRRFKDHVLRARWNGRSIADVFGMTVDEAQRFFGDRPNIVRRLEPLSRVGLGYLRLGQSTSQLSGGEGQRLKLASYVGGSGGGRHVFLFDEPTVGLHMRDVVRLVGALRLLTDAGHTVIVVEHNLDFVAACDWVVDLGPGAGPDGGSVVYEGEVGGLAECPGSRTGVHLRGMLQGGVA
ncbi:MAG: excinuclease ABC subunit A [Deltaproteobacteria bacterium]|nr:MAG: excinuclease ABC subunit A [Deltaproteobacteria bacterium]